MSVTASNLYKHHPLPDSERLQAVSSKLHDTKSLRAEDYAALQDYKGSGFSIMNRMLRSSQYPVVQFRPMLQALAKQLVACRAQPRARVIDRRPMWEQEAEAEEQLMRSYLDQSNATI